MIGFFLVCAAWLGGSALVLPGCWGITEELSPAEYFVEIRWLQEKPDTSIQVTLCPRVTLKAGQRVRYDESIGWHTVDEDSDSCQLRIRSPRLKPTDKLSDHFFQIRLIPESGPKVRLDLELHHQQIETAFLFVQIVQSKHNRFERQIQPGERERIVIDRNENGVANSWLDLLIRETARDDSYPSDDEDFARQLRNSVHPFWYEPF